MLQPKCNVCMAKEVSFFKSKTMKKIEIFPSENTLKNLTNFKLVARVKREVRA